MKLTFSSNQAFFSTWPKSQDKNLNILRTKRAFKVKQKAFFIIFKELSAAKNCLRPESALLKLVRFSGNLCIYPIFDWYWLRWKLKLLANKTWITWLCALFLIKIFYHLVKSIVTLWFSKKLIIVTKLTNYLVFQTVNYNWNYKVFKL